MWEKALNLLHQKTFDTFTLTSDSRLFDLSTHNGEANDSARDTNYGDETRDERRDDEVGTWWVSDTAHIRDSSHIFIISVGHLKIDSPLSPPAILNPHDMRKPSNDIRTRKSNPKDDVFDLKCFMILIDVVIFTLRLFPLWLDLLLLLNFALYGIKDRAARRTEGEVFVLWEFMFMTLIYAGGIAFRECWTSTRSSRIISFTGLSFCTNWVSAECLIDHHCLILINCVKFSFRT